MQLVIFVNLNLQSCIGGYSQTNSRHSAIGEILWILCFDFQPDNHAACTWLGSHNL